jgi:hypothetical protein
LAQIKPQAVLAVQGKAALFLGLVVQVQEAQH